MVEYPLYGTAFGTVRFESLHSVNEVLSLSKRVQKAFIKRWRYAGKLAP
jgi:hypothetical protein